MISSFVVKGELSIWQGRFVLQTILMVEKGNDLLVAKRKRFSNFKPPKNSLHLLHVRLGANFFHSCRLSDMLLSSTILDVKRRYKNFFQNTCHVDYFELFRLMQTKRKNVFQFKRIFSLLRIYFSCLQVLCVQRNDCVWVASQSEQIGVNLTSKLCPAFFSQRLRNFLIRSCL